MSLPAVRRRLRLLAMPALGGGVALAALAGCDPCSGMATCSTEPRFAYEGRFIEYWGGAPVAGVEIAVTRAAEPRLRDTLGTARTNGDGFYAFDVPATADTATVDVSVRPPSPWRPYVVRDVRLAATRRLGDGGQLGRWVVNPYFAMLGELTNRRTQRRLADAQVSWRRTGGVALGRDTASSRTDAAGRFYIELPGDGFGDVVGDLTVRSSALPRTFVLSGVRLALEHRDRVADPNAVFGVGSSLHYSLEFWDRSTRTKLTGGTVEWRRTGGVAASPATVTRTIDANGRISLELTPDADGEVVGDVTVRRANRPDYVVRGIRLRTFDTDEVRFAGVFNVGLSLFYSGEVWDRGRREKLAGATVTFVRTGGIATEPASFTRTTDANGRFAFALSPLAAGTVSGLLVVQRPGAAPDTVRGLSLATFDGDAFPLLGVWNVGQALNYVIRLSARYTDASLPGLAVEFRRTGGIAIEPDTIRGTTLAWGGFGLMPRTSQVGEVVGDVIVRRPGKPDFVATGVRMRTRADDTVRYAGAWQLGPSLDWVGELLREETDRPIVGARVEFRRTGGIAVTPEVLTDTTNQSGRFRLSPRPLAEGEVVGDIVIRMPAPLRDTTIRNVRLPTFEDAQSRLFGVWRFRAP